MAVGRVRLRREIQFYIEQYNKIYNFLLAVRQFEAKELVRSLFLRKCCFCVPLDVGVSLLFIIEMATLTPFSVYPRYKLARQIAIILMVCLLAAAVSHSWTLVWRKPKYAWLSLGLSFNVCVFHAVMAGVDVCGDALHTQKARTVHYIFLIVNTYCKMQEGDRRSQLSQSKV